MWNSIKTKLIGAYSLEKYIVRPGYQLLYFNSNTPPQPTHQELLAELMKELDEARAKRAELLKQPVVNMFRLEELNDEIFLLEESRGFLLGDF